MDAEQNPRGPANEAYVFTAYPISNTFRERVNEVAGGNAQFILLAEIRNRGMKGMLRFLRSFKRSAAIYIPLEDQHSEPLLPVLLAVAAASSAGRVFVIRSDGSVRPVGPFEIGRTTMGLLTSALAGIFALLRTCLVVAWLRHSRRLEVAPYDSTSILYINANLWFGVRAGGSVGHVAGVANAFADRGYDVDLASANHQVMLRKSVRQHLLAPPRTFGFPYELNYFRYNYLALRQLRRIARGRRFSFLYQRMSVMNLVGVLLSRRWRVPLVLEYNGSEIWVARNWGRKLRFSNIGLAIEQVCLRYADRIVVVSKVLADELVERGVDASRIVCYPNCVDPQFYGPDVVPAERSQALRERHSIPPDATLISFVGTFGQWHGAPVLAQAIKQLADDESSWLEERRVRFAMIGDGLKMKEVRELIGGAEYSRWVTFTGLVPQAETATYLAASDILVSPHVRNSDGSRFFGSPTKLFEYMAMQKGIIASDLDQIGEVLSAGLRIWEEGAILSSARKMMAATAVLIRPGEVEDLIAAIKLLIESPEISKRTALNAREELLRRYTWRHHVGRIVESLSPKFQQEVRGATLAQSVR